MGKRIGLKIKNKEINQQDPNITTSNKQTKKN